jgi:cytochrome c oxidase assembly factor CtaG
MILAHHPVAPGSLWSQWTFEPATVALITAAALLYSVGRARLCRRRGPRVGTTSRAVAFYAGLALLAVALLSPIHALGETLFSAHMVQHLLLIFGVAPLLVLGTPLLPALVALPPAVRRDLGALRHRSLLRMTRRALMYPLVVWALHALALWSWHLPAPYRIALDNPGLHVLEHSSFLLTAIAFWSLVIETRRRRRLAHPLAILFVFTTALHSGALGALLAFASRPLYPLHTHGARAWGLTPLADQQLAGLVMWVPSGAFYLVTMAALLFAWLRELERAHPPVAVSVGDRG